MFYDNISFSTYWAKTRTQGFEDDVSYGRNYELLKREHQGTVGISARQRACGYPELDNRAFIVRIIRLFRF